MLKFHARTDVGLRRKHNEDSLLAAEEYGLFVVADGVGGRKAGELASAITVNTFQTYGPKLRMALEAYGADPGRPTRTAVMALLDQATNAASKRVFEAAEATGRQGMTTTMVAAAVGAGSAFIAHVGDSRVYLVRDKEMKLLTEDHSMVNELIRTGALLPEEAERSPYRNVITKAIGLYPQVRPDTLHVELVAGDRILLCSDGLHDMVPAPILTKLALQPNLTQSVDSMIAAALEGGGKDNVTCIAIEAEATREAEAVAAHARIMENLWLFKDLPYQARLRVGKICHERKFQPNEKIVSKGEMGDALFVVIQGQMSVQVDGQEVAVLKEGEHFGELALIENEPRSADIVAKTFGTLLAVDRTAFREFCMMEPALGNLMLWKLVTSLGQRLRSMNEQVRAK